MKKTMLWVIMAVVAIILMVSFDLSFAPHEPIVLSAESAPNALFVCPVTESTWTTIANGLNKVQLPIKIGILFACLLLIAFWSWALYQNLLKDKFDRASYKNPWAYTKILFWAIIAVFILMKTPDYFRFVQVDGAPGNWVLCENNTPGAKAVYANKVHDAKH